MYCVVAYDIPDNRRRGRLFKKLKGFGAHAQFSVFECELQEAQFIKMVTEIRKTISTAEDNIKIYLLCRDCLRNVVVMGTANLARRPECIII